MALTAHDWMLAWVNLIHAGTYMASRLDGHFRAELGISLPEQDLLNVLEKVGGEVKLSDLARHVYLSKAGMTKMIGRLAKAGLVERQASRTDRRAASARLTRSGRRLLHRSRRQLHDWVKTNFRAHLSEKEVVAVRQALGSLLEGHGRYKGQMAHLRGEPGG